MLKLNCKNCGKEFITYPSKIKSGGGKYCSRKCSNADGCSWKYMNEFDREKRVNKMKNCLMTKEVKNKLSISKLGAKNHNWKGDNVGYYALHIWVNRQLGRSDKCEDCANLTSKNYVWANISGEYKRDLTDWKRLCASCNKKDGIPIAERFL